MAIVGVMGLSAASVLAGLRAPQSQWTALDRYVAAPDDSYSWRLDHVSQQQGYTAYVLEMVSQTWRTEDEVNRTQWKHWVQIAMPDVVSHDTAMLIIEGGNNSSRRPPFEPLMGMVASMTESVVVWLWNVPNQPLRFADESRKRTEDAVIAYSWDKFLRTGDETWPAQLPMTKAAVRAMDATQEFLASEAGGGLAIHSFVAGGGSKRGWATWLTAAVDDRVTAIAPLVIDVLNVQKSFVHHYNAYGFWAPAVTDYVEMGIMDWLGTPGMDALMDIVDPYVYIDRYTMPKMIINASGDQFFLPDSSQFYWDDLIGEKHLRYAPNADHGMGDAAVDIGFSLAAFYHSILADSPRPQFTWSLEPDGSIHIQVDPNVPPVMVRQWQATNPTARDFRVDTIGKAYTSTDLTDQGGGHYVGRVETPETGWTAFFVELHYDSGWLFPYKMSTQVRVLPEPTTLDVEVVNGHRSCVAVEPDRPQYYHPDTVVTLTAAEGDDRAFLGWEVLDAGDPMAGGQIASGEVEAGPAALDANATIQVTMDRDRLVRARYDYYQFQCGEGVVQTLPLALLVTGLISGVVAWRRRSAA